MIVREQNCPVNSALESTHASPTSSQNMATEDLVAPATPAGARTSLKANCAWTAGSNALFAGCQWLMLMMIAKLCPPSAVGQFTMAMAVTSPIFQFSTLQLRPILATDLRGQYTFSEYLALRVYTTVAACIATLFICAVTDDSSATKWVIALVGISKAFDAISDIFHARLQKEERMDRIALGIIARGVISLVILAAVLLVTRSVALSVAGLAFGSAVVALGFDCNNGRAGFDFLRSRRWWDPHWLMPASETARRLLRLSRTALPLGIVLLLTALIANIPRLFVKYHFGVAALGLFGAAAYVMAAMNVLIGSVGQSAMPRLASLYSAGQTRALLMVLAKAVAFALAAGGLGVAASVVGGRQILTYLYREEYATQTALFTLLMCVAAVMSVATILSYAVMAVRSFNSQLPLFTAVMVTTCLGCYLLMPGYGPSGAALGLLAGVSVQLLGSIAVLAVVLRQPRSSDAPNPTSSPA
jgi:O-antigen/teichoic acid export membrane protein